MHGSVSWKKISEDKIEVKYPHSYPSELEVNIDGPSMETAVEMINDNLFIQSAKDTLNLSTNDDEVLGKFQKEYNNLAIVNPTKAKFEETVFQQHYYQSLRLLSYELEKPQTVLICFGFSFKDEHIREIISRSLSNPSLIIYVFCYKKTNKQEIQNLISNKNNIHLS